MNLYFRIVTAKVQLINVFFKWNGLLSEFVATPIQNMLPTSQAA